MTLPVERCWHRMHGLSGTQHDNIMLLQPNWRPKIGVVFPAHEPFCSVLRLSHDRKVSYLQHWSPYSSNAALSWSESENNSPSSGKSQVSLLRLITNKNQQKKHAVSMSFPFIEKTVRFEEHLSKCHPGNICLQPYMVAGNL